MAVRDENAGVEYLNARLSWGFKWGGGERLHDCVLFVADGVLAVTGVDYMGELRGLWTDEDSALRVIQERGGPGGLFKAMDGVLERIPPAAGHRFDVGGILVDRMPTLCWLEGQTVAAAGPRGLTRYPRRALVRAWRVA